MITPEAKKAMDDWEATRSPNLKPRPRYVSSTQDISELEAGVLYIAIDEEPAAPYPRGFVLGEYRFPVLEALEAQKED